ncbi:MAG: hypothetical protein ACPLY9_03650 [Nitrososphaerales archaeon]
MESIRNKLSSKGFKVGQLIGKSGKTGQSQEEQVKALEGLSKDGIMSQIDLMLIKKLRRELNKVRKT